nr:hypothetical protein [Phytoactinopolyspora mesophila]
MCSQRPGGEGGTVGGAAVTEAPGWVTVAERLEMSFVFAGYLPEDFPPTRGTAEALWWREVRGADWRQPEGPHSEH